MKTFLHVSAMYILTCGWDK